jgi:tetratricopeptide (TPR) repeat protein
LPRRCRELGGIELDLGNADAAAAKYRDALEQFRSAGDRSGHALMLANLASCARMSGLFDEASQLATESLVMRRETGHKRGAAYALLYLADAERMQCHWSDAVARYREALIITSRIFYPAGGVEALERVGLLVATYGAANVASNDPRLGSHTA